MSLAAPFALVGLGALPLVWWLHRRLRRPPEVLLPSLMFLRDEEDANTLPRGRPFDAELLLALAAVCLLSLAAAGPRIDKTRAHRVVRVVVSGGTAASARGYDQRVRAVLADIRAGMAAEDVLRVEHVPARPAPDTFVPRPTPAALLGAARAGEAALRVVISDEDAPAETGDVRWVSAGEPAAANVGFVALSVAPSAKAGADGAEADLDVFYALANYGPETARVLVRVHTGDGDTQAPGPSARMTLKPDAYGSNTIRMGGGHPRIGLSLSRADGGDLADHLVADDRVELLHTPLPVHVSDELGDLGERVMSALRAAIGSTAIGTVRADDADRAALAFVPRGTGGPTFPDHTWVVAFETAREGDAVSHAGAGTNPRGRDPVVRDLSAAGVDWVYAPDAERPAPGEEVLLLRRGAREWPIVLRHGHRVRLAPDPTRGTPAAVDTAFWPLLIDNLTRLAGRGEVLDSGRRAVGLLDARTSRLGRARSEFEPAWIRAAPATVPATGRPLRPLLILGALACMLTLWGAPRLRRRLVPNRY